jgi:hypothetical protein
MDNASAVGLPDPLPFPTSIVERRRGGRIACSNPALIELLRRPTSGPLEAEAIDDVGNVLEPARGLVRQGERGFAITNPENLLRRPDDAPAALRQTEWFQPQSGAMAVALAKRLCRDDRYQLEWVEFLAREVGKIWGFITGRDYPKEPPTADSINALIAKFVSLSEVVRRSCLVSGRWGTPEANRVVASAVRSLGSWTQAVGGYSYWSDLRAFCASLCFYWALAGAVARNDFTSAEFLMHTRVTRNGVDDAIVSALPLLALGSIEWKVLKGFEQRSMPASDFLFGLFEREIADAAIDPREAEDLFGRSEFLISLEFSHLRLQQIAANGRRLWFWTPLGRYICKPGGANIQERLAEYENLPANHGLLKAGLLGGTPASASRAAEAMRQRFNNSTCLRDDAT